MTTGPLDGDDLALSTSISPPARRPEHNLGLRTLMVGRLSDTVKAVARLSLRGGKLSLFCEPCSTWIRAEDDDFPQEWRCPLCERVFEMEFAVLEEVE